MSFKNKKEEVLDIQLTSFGKMLLSKGQFKPEFYTFFDDDVLYDTMYVSEEEPQNYAETRILEETPITQTQVVYEGLETQITKQISDIRRGLKTSAESFQNTSEKEYALSAPLGKSSLSTDTAPSWDITSYGSSFESKTVVDTNHPMDIKIPQLKLKNIDFYTVVVDTAVDLEAERETGTQAGDANPGHPWGPAGFTDVYDNDMRIDVTENYLVLEVDELNTQSEKENYDIELFIVEDRLTLDGWKEDLMPLLFKKVPEIIVDGIYDDEKFREEVDRRNDEESNPTHADHYFEIMVDTEIDPQLLCNLGYRPDFSKRGAIRVDCGDNKLGNTRMDDVYNPFGEASGPYGDDC